MICRFNISIKLNDIKQILTFPPVSVHSPSKKPFVGRDLLWLMPAKMWGRGKKRTSLRPVLKTWSVQFVWLDMRKNIQFLFSNIGRRWEKSNPL